MNICSGPLQPTALSLLRTHLYIPSRLCVVDSLLLNLIVYIVVGKKKAAHKPFSINVQSTLLIHEVHDLVEVHFAALQVRYAVELEAGCGHLLRQLVKRVVQHDLIAGFE